MIDPAQNAAINDTVLSVQAYIEDKCDDLRTRDFEIFIMPGTFFLPFATASQLLGTDPYVQKGWIQNGMLAVGQAIGQRSSTRRYGKGRACATPSLEAVQQVLEHQKNKITEWKLVPDGPAKCRDLLRDSLLDFCVLAKILEPSGLGDMIDRSNQTCLEVLASGFLTRNEIKIRG